MKTESFRCVTTSMAAELLPAQRANAAALDSDFRLPSAGCDGQDAFSKKCPGELKIAQRSTTRGLRRMMISDVYVTLTSTAWKSVRCRSFSFNVLCVWTRKSKMFYCLTGTDSQQLTFSTKTNSRSATIDLSGIFSCWCLERNRKSPTQHSQILNRIITILQPLDSL